MREAPVAAALVLVLALLLAAPAAAHGPTVRVAWSGVRPATLTVRAGDTVHFHNANSSAGTCTVVGEGDAFRSPALGRAEGWHHTFPEPGTFPFHVAEFPDARGRIVVVEP